MSSTTLALSSSAAGRASPACPPLTPMMMSRKFLVFPSSPAAARSPQLPLGRRCCCPCSSIACASIMMTGRGRRRSSISCEVASLSSSSATVTEEEDEEQQRAEKKIGAKIRVKVPLKVYHVPRVPEVDLTGKEGHLKQYVGLWKGKRISANYPYKIQFVVDIEGRGPVKFLSHLKEDEFEYLD